MPVSLSLINFHKFITGDEKWVLHNNPKRRKSWLDLANIDHKTQYSHKKSLAKVKVPNLFAHLIVKEALFY